MRFEDITVKFIEGTEHPYEKKPNLNIYEIDAENLEEMEFCTCGAHLKKKHKSKRTIYDYRPSPFTGVKHNYRIKLYSQRYVCTNPDCKCSFTAGLLDRSKSSRAFSELIIKKLLDNNLLNYNKVAEELGVSHTFIGDVVRDFSLEFNLNFSPSQFCKYLYLHEFIYQKEPRLCLVSVNNMDEQQLIGFFGYKDHKKEFADYLRFHLKDDDIWFTISTENADEFANNFEQFPGQVFFVDSQKCRDEKLKDSYAYKLEGGVKSLYDPYLRELKEIQNILKSLHPKKLLKNWLNKSPKDLIDIQAKEHLEELVVLLLNDSKYVAEYGIYTASFKEYEKHINAYNQQNVPFERMCLHMIHREYKKHKKHILTDVNKENSLYDEQNETIYYPTPLENNEKLKDESHRRFELYRNEEENYDIFDYMDPEDVTLCDDPSEIPEDIIQEMATRSNSAISEEDLYYIQQFLEE